MKTCIRCKETKKISDFYKEKTNKDGLRGECKLCGYLRRKQTFVSKAKQKPIVKDGYKICCVCKSEKLKSEFYNNSGTFDGLTSQCIVCRKIIASERKEKDKEYKRRWTKNNDPRLKLEAKARRLKNRDKYLENSREYYSKNRENILQKQKEWRENNKELKSLRDKQWREKNRDRKKTNDRLYNLKNRDKNKPARNDYNRRKKIENPALVIEQRIRASFQQRLVNSSISKDKPLSKYTDFKISDYIVNFKKDQNWNSFCENSKNYHIDHIIPCSIYNFLNPVEVKQCWNPRNLRILPAKENMHKKAKIDLNLILQLGIQDLLPFWIER